MSIIDFLLNKKTDDKLIYDYLGSYQSCYLAHAKSDIVRLSAASGGVTSSLIIFLLERKIIDGAVVCKSIVLDGKVRAQWYIAQDIDSIIEAQGSKYVITDFVKEAIPLVKKFEGKLAVVGLPCNIEQLKRLTQTERNKIVCTIALFCGHTSKPELVDHITSRLKKDPASVLQAFRFRSGHWRGMMQATFSNGKIALNPYAIYGLYQNLFFFCADRCIHCYDHYGYEADISVGDVWLYKFKRDKIKHNAVITKTPAGESLFNGALASGAIESSHVDVRTIVNGQKRGGPFHYNLSARAKAGKLIGVRIRDRVNVSVKWHQLLAAVIVLVNWKVSRNERLAGLIMKIPRPILITYLYLLKGLQSL